MQVGPEDSALLAIWRRRYAGSDVLGAWRQAPLAEAGQYAFIAIALDPAVLAASDPAVASRLAMQARSYVSLNCADDPAGAGLRAAAARLVRAAVWQWQGTQGDEFNLPAANGPAAGAALLPKSPPPEPPPAVFWQAALRNFPQFDGRTGRAAAVLVVRSEGAALAACRPPWNHVLALGTLRHAARAARGDVTDTGCTPAQLLEAVCAVQRFSAETRLAPLRVPYVGRRGTPAEQAVALSQDAAALQCLLRSTAPEHLPALVAAEGMHAFAAVALDPAVLQDLPLTALQRLADAAIRFAAAAAQAGPEQTADAAADPAGEPRAGRRGGARRRAGHRRECAGLTRW